MMTMVGSSPVWLVTSESSRRHLLSLQTQVPLGHGWSRLQNKVNVKIFPQVFVVQEHTCCDISHQFSRPRAWRCHRRCLWQRTWSWTEGTSQPTDAYWGLSWQMIIIFGSGTVNEWTMNSDKWHLTSAHIIILPDRVWRHCPVRISQILTVESALPETKMLSRNSIPEVKLWISRVNGHYLPNCCHQNMVPVAHFLHLMAHKGVPAGAWLHVPDPDGGVQRPRHHVYSIKLRSRSLFMWIAEKGRLEGQRKGGVCLCGR